MLIEVFKRGRLPLGTLNASEVGLFPQYQIFLGAFETLTDGHVPGSMKLSSRADANDMMRLRISYLGGPAASGETREAC